MSGCTVNQDMAVLTEGIQRLTVAKGDLEDKRDDKEQVEDDGYSSEGKSDKAEQKEKEDQDDDEDGDVILEPLSIIPSSPPPMVENHYITITSRGPIDQEGHYNRNHPYSRPGHPQIPTGGVTTITSTTENRQPPPAVVLVLRKGDTRNPSKLEARVTWSNKHELCIERYLLPEDTYFGEETVENKVQLFIQLNPNVKELKSFLADVKTEFDTTGESKKRYIGPIVISLKTELAESQENRLLKMTTMDERTAAYNLVHQKELSQLTSGIGPHKDTVLSVLCAKRNPENPGQTYAQIHAVIQRLINHPDNSVRQTVFRLNNNQISAFEIAAITNNRLVACYLAEVMYNISEDTRSALRVLNCKDTQGNSILHLLARKGDSNLATMQDLLDMLLTDGTRVFTMISNSKKQFPMHIATQNVKNQPGTIRLLYQHMPRAFEVVDDDGMTALQYAAQRTTDVEMVGTVLSYKKDNINARNKDGLTALDLVTRRCQSTTQTLGLFAIDQKQQNEIIMIIRNNGGKSGVLNELQQQRPALPQQQVEVQQQQQQQQQQHQTGCLPTNMGYIVPGSPPPLSASPEGSPSSLGQSSVTSPHTPHTPVSGLGSPCSLSGPSMNSVGSFPQSSPESTPQGSPAIPYQPSPHYQPHLDSPVGHIISYEDHIASQILTQFPEIGQILDNQ